LENIALGLEAEEEETIKNVAATAYAGKLYAFSFNSSGRA